MIMTATMLGHAVLGVASSRRASRLSTCCDVPNHPPTLAGADNALDPPSEQALDPRDTKDGSAARGEGGKHAATPTKEWRSVAGASSVGAMAPLELRTLRAGSLLIRSAAARAPLCVRPTRQAHSRKDCRVRLTRSLPGVTWAQLSSLTPSIWLRGRALRRSYTLTP